MGTPLPNGPSASFWLSSSSSPNPLPSLGDRTCLLLWSPCWDPWLSQGRTGTPTSALEPPPVLLCISMGECQLPSCPQFVCVECLVTASVDMFPSQLRKSGRRELLILAIAVVCYLIGLFLVTEVSVGGGVACRMGSRVREPGATPSLSATWGC